MASPGLDETIYLFRMTHINNVAHIYQYGITHRASPKRNPFYYSIGDTDLIARRDNKILQNGCKLGDYIPFYFCVKSPMLYVLTKNGRVKSEDIVYCVTSVAEIEELNLPFLFTDGHAFEALSKFYNPKDLANISNLVDFSAVKASQWSGNIADLDIKRKKQAEFLVLGDIGRKAILGFVVYSEVAKQKLCSFGISEQQIFVKNNWYY